MKRPLPPLSVRAKNKRHALTLIELVASAVLLSIMMVVLSNVLWGIVRQTRSLTRQTTSSTSPNIAIDTIAGDLTNARGMLISEDGILLRGYFPPSLVLANVQYKIETKGEHRVLTRQSENQKMDLWVGIGRLEIKSMVARTIPQDVAAQRPSLAASPLPTIPELFRVTMIDSGGNTIWRRVVQHHGS